MSQEWDYPPNRKWEPEITVLPGAKPEFRRFDKTIDHQKPRSRTGWAWYRAEMQGGGSLLYKLNVTALYFTLCGFIFAVVALIGVVVGLLISNAARAEDALTDATKDKIFGATSPLMSAYFGATICDYEILPSVGGLYLTEKLGSDFKASPTDISVLLFMDHAQQSLAATLGVIPKTQKQKVQYCNQILQNFGPNGTTIAGVLKQ